MDLLLMLMAKVLTMLMLVLVVGMVVRMDMWPLWQRRAEVRLWRMTRSIGGGRH